MGRHFCVVLAKSPNGTTGQWNNGTTAAILYAQDTKVPDVIGDWGVQAFFQDSTGRTKSGLEDVIKISTKIKTIVIVDVERVNPGITVAENPHLSPFPINQYPYILTFEASDNIF